MTAAAEHEPAAQAGCWCCGRILPEHELVRLGEHPEVGLCLRCATWAKRQAVARYHEQHQSLPGQLLHGIDTVRNRVIERGWHERGLLGAVLRRVDRYLP